jgi:hypothetical protein
MPEGFGFVRNDVRDKLWKQGRVDDDLPDRFDGSGYIDRLFNGGHSGVEYFDASNKPAAQAPNPK